VQALRAAAPVLAHLPAAQRLSPAGSAVPRS